MTGWHVAHRSQQLDEAQLDEAALGVGTALHMGTEQNTNACSDTLVYDIEGPVQDWPRR